MKKKNKLFTPIDGVLVEIQKEEKNIAGIELPENSQKKNEGIIVSKDIRLTTKTEKEFKDIATFNLVEGMKIKFLEGIVIEDNLFFVYLNKIVGIYNN